MYLRSLLTVLLIWFLAADLTARQVPLDRCVSDSLFSIRPHENHTQEAMIYLELAELIREELPEKSFSYLVSAFRMAIREGNDTLKASARLKMGDYYSYRRRFLLANEQYFAAWKTYQMSGDTAGVIKALISIAGINRVLRSEDEALPYLQKGMGILRRSNNNTLKGLIYDNIGLVYQSMGDSETALYFLNRALALFRQTGDRKMEFWVRNNIGTFFLDENRYDEGLTFYLQLLEEIGEDDHELLGVVCTRIGHIFCQQNDFRSSLTWNLRALKERQQYRSVLAVNSSLINVAGDYYNLDRPDSGMIYMDLGLIQSRRAGQKNLLENGYRHLYSYYLRVKDYKQALDYYARYVAMRDDIIREQNRNSIAILEAYQQIQQVQQSGKMMARKRDIQALNLKYHDNQSVILQVMVGLAGISMIVVTGWLLYIRRVRRKMQDLNVRLSDEMQEREAVEERTRERESQYKFITDNSIDFITHMDDRKMRTYASPASMTVYGYEPAEILERSPYDLTHPDFHESAERMLQEMLLLRSSRQFVYKAVKKDGSEFWVESILNPSFDPVTGDFKGMTGVTRDLQERKTKEFEIMEATKQKENLLREIHHRVKNNFAILVSLINMQKSQTKNPELLQSLTNLQLRIRTMALVHEMLYRSGDFEKISFPGYLRSIASVIAGTYNRRDVELTIEADEVVMDIEASIPLGLIINEILNNAYKHAFPDGRPGKIRIRFTSEPQTGISSLVLQDDGIGMPAGMKLTQFKTMGLQVVQILCTQIEAKLEVDNDPGAKFTLTFGSSRKIKN